MKNLTGFFLAAVFFFALFSRDAVPDEFTGQDEKKHILHQIYLYREVTQYLDDMFKRFSEGYMEPDAALERVNALKHEYDKKTAPIPEDARDLHQLTMELLSRVENYFIFYKRVYREDPGINYRILDSKIKLSRESFRLQQLYAR